MKFVLFKKQKNEKFSKYSFVSNDTFKSIPKNIVLGSKSVRKGVELTKELAEKLSIEIQKNIKGSK